MNLLQAVLLGIIQGIAEFLPISSSGHLVLLQRIFGIQEPMMAVDIVLHLGSLLAVFIVFWSEIWAIVRRPFQKMTALLALATLPAVIAALLLQEQMETLFRGGFFLAVAFIITGLLLLYSDSLRTGKKRNDDIRFIDALVIGFMQAMGIPPGISRSGATITGALTMGLTRESAAQFSFLLSIPTILGAAVFAVKDLAAGEYFIGEFGAVGLLPLLFGFLAAALTGYLSIRFMLSLIQRCKMRFFSYYVFALAFLILLDHFALHNFF